MKGHRPPTKKDNVMDNASIVAVGKLLAKDLPDLTAGKYEVDEVITLRVKASISKGQDYMVRPTTSVPWLKVAKWIAYHSSNQDTTAATQLAIEAVAFCMDPANAETLDNLLGDVDEEVDRMVEKALDALPKAPRKGATTVKGEIEILE
jgi:hypothetical protein